MSTKNYSILKEEDELSSKPKVLTSVPCEQSCRQEANAVCATVPSERREEADSEVNLVLRLQYCVLDRWNMIPSLEAVVISPASRRASSSWSSLDN
uniref:Uncharacterized protein n=1 Tax=Timema bartmani TaxID=61472 RepID=A0A7R9F605_9NEOP|nr:unnamed protein product [Timema bartmani]